MKNESDTTLEMFRRSWKEDLDIRYSHYDGRTIGRCVLLVDVPYVKLLAASKAVALIVMRKGGMPTPCLILPTSMCPNQVLLHTVLA